MNRDARSRACNAADKAMHGMWRAQVIRVERGLERMRDACGFVDASELPLPPDLQRAIAGAAAHRGFYRGLLRDLVRRAEEGGIERRTEGHASAVARVRDALERETKPA